MLHTDFHRVLHPWTLYVERQPVGSWLLLADALAAWWEFVQNGRWAILVRECEHGSNPNDHATGTEVREL